MERNSMRKIIFGVIGFLLLVNHCFSAQDVNVESLKISHVTTILTTAAGSLTLLPPTALSGRKSIMIENLSTNILYIGNASITSDQASTGGWQLRNQGDSVTLDFTDSIEVYGLTSSGSFI